MATNTAGRLHSARQRLLFEGKREREFYRYYQPIRELTKAGPPLCDLGDERSLREHRPFSSPDRALTAFCQLGALRLGMKRAMLFFFDSNHAYSLAEATQTLSLQDDSVHASDDDLWLGHTMIPRGHSLCEATVMLPINEGSNRDQDSASVAHIVNDLTEDSRFCDRVFVREGPRCRFYAGVPITTPRGINIGAYCVLDDKKHSGLSPDGICFLRDMAATVMTHLEMVRGTAEHKIGTQMIAGLGAFIDGASGFRDWAAQKNDFGLDEDPNLSHPLGAQPLTANASAVAQAAVQITEQLEEDEGVVVTNYTTNPTRSRASTLTNANFSSMNHSARQPSTMQGKRNADKFDDPAALSEQKTFERACTLIREALSIDGVAFLDAAVGTFGGLVETTHNESAANTEVSSDYPGSAAECTTGTEGEDKAEHMSSKSGSENGPRSCRVLASSFTPAPPQLDPHLKANYANCVKRPEEFTEKLLRTLLRRYPRGKIWSFNEYGDASSEDESSEYNTDASSCRCSADADVVSQTRHSSSCPKRLKKTRLDDSKEIWQFFGHGIRNVGLVGMWDHTRQRWYAASMFWSYSPLRMFSEESEIKYMTAFCDVILAELHRLEAQNSDRAKSDFISTISHELRSPLHGILGSVECLQEQPMDSFCTGLTSQIEICGRTLLDIIDHLLDFSKINHHAKSRIAPGAEGRSRKLFADATKRSRMGGMMQIDNDVSLDDMTEEVIETAVYSFCCSRDPDMILRRKVAVVLDIDRTAEIDFKVHMAIGAWKRICINLVSNALKYTSEGHIKVSLKASQIPDKKKRMYITLTVADTGRGMSPDFLENHLFRAFAQEDSLIEGTGLGMNLVAKIVRSFEGKIEVQSEKGVGSVFSVTIPVERSNPRGREMTRKASSRYVDQITSNVTIGMIDNRSAPLALDGVVPNQTARSVLLGSIHKTLAQTSAVTIPCTWAGDEKADLYFVTEGEVAEELQRRQDMGVTDMLMSPSALSNKPFIILCNSSLSARRIRAPGLGNIATGYVELIAQPVGPKRLLKAIESCMRNKNFVGRATAIAGAVKEIPSLVPYPDQQNISHNLPVRTRQESTNLDSPTDTKSKTAGLDGAAADQGLAELERKEMQDRDLASDYRFPRTPTPALNGSKPIILSGDSNNHKPSAKTSGDLKSKNGVSLLLVDDNPINLQLLVTYADRGGHRKIVATDGQQAVEAYKAACLEQLELDKDAHPPITRNDSGNDSVKPIDDPAPAAPIKPQVILMDINMPVLNGFEATRQIRGFEKQKGLEASTIIALTGLGSASAQQEAFSSGVDLFLTKPVRLRELTKILEGIQKK